MLDFMDTPRARKLSRLVALSFGICLAAMPPTGLAEIMLCQDEGRSDPPPRATAVFGATSTELTFVAANQDLGLKRSAKMATEFVEGVSGPGLIVEHAEDNFLSELAFTSLDRKERRSISCRGPVPQAFVVRIADRATLTDPRTGAARDLGLVLAGEPMGSYWSRYDAMVLDFETGELRLIPRPLALCPPDNDMANQLACGAFMTWKGRPAILLSGIQADVSVVVDAFTGELVEELDFGFNVRGGFVVGDSVFVVSFEQGGLVELPVDGGERRVHPFPEGAFVYAWEPVDGNDASLTSWLQYGSEGSGHTSKLQLVRLNLATGALEVDVEVPNLGWIRHLDVSPLGAHRVLRAISIVEVEGVNKLQAHFLDFETGELLLHVVFEEKIFDALLVEEGERHRLWVNRSSLEDRLWRADVQLAATTPDSAGAGR